MTATRKETGWTQDDRQPALQGAERPAQLSRRNLCRELRPSSCWCTGPSLSVAHSLVLTPVQSPQGREEKKNQTLKAPHPRARALEIPTHLSSGCSYPGNADAVGVGSEACQATKRAPSEAWRYQGPGEARRVQGAPSPPPFASIPEGLSLP